MKVLSIGRDAGCSICCDNPMISRRHALIKVYPNGKIELISFGKNGTYVNGILCKQNVPYPIKRKDVVSFAHVSELDWALVPNPLGWVRYAIIGLISIVVLVVISVVGVKIYELYDTPENNLDGMENMSPTESPKKDKGENEGDKQEDKDNSTFKDPKDKKKNKSKKDLINGFKFGNDEPQKVDSEKKKEKKKENSDNKNSSKGQQDSDKKKEQDKSDSSEDISIY